MEDLSPNLTIYKDGFGVVRRSDFVIFSVETAHLCSVVEKFGPSMKVGSIACGQTSVKMIEIDAFEAFLPEDVHIVTCHSMHGPTVNPKGQPLVVINHRSSKQKYDIALSILETLKSEMVFLTGKEHDRITADTQAATHLAFLSMGTAWKTHATFPWEHPSYSKSIENVKILITLRIYASKWHVYAGLAMMNPDALAQIQQYSKSVSELFKLMLLENEAEFVARIKKAREFVFVFDRKPIMLSDSLLDQFSLSEVPKDKRKPNSHLSLLAVVDCWYQLKIQPYDHLICETPPFRLLLGIAEYLFRNDEMLDESIHAALYDKSIRADDCEFYTAAKGWVETIAFGGEDAYKQRFESTADFFKERAASGRRESARLIEFIAQKG